MGGMNSLSENPRAPLSVCPGCGAQFTCGVSSTQASCWCMQLPPIAFASFGGGQCYCPQCLEKAMGAAADNTEAAVLETPREAEAKNPERNADR